MRGHSHLGARPWMLAVGAVVLIEVQVIFFERLRHAGVSFAVLSGLALLLIAKHLGLLGPLFGLVWRRPRS